LKELTFCATWLVSDWFGVKAHVSALKVAHPLKLRAIAAAKKKNDRIGASKICDCLRCDSAGMLHGFDGHSRAAAYIALPQPAGAPVRQMVQMKNKRRRSACC
jgi:hypothetical protein